MRNLKKILALALALVMSLSLMATANAFTDDDSINDTYETAVTVLSGLKVFQGYDDGSFLPQGAITRAEVAAIIYRIVTGDVADTQVGIYADYNKFDDVASTSWYAGYVNFCANAEYIKGYDARTFGPNDPVTGYQALAMILRALGYDKNGEFTGTNWTIQTAAVGEQRGITKNITAGTLNVPATREVVAEILFRAILVPTVNYTPAFGYTIGDTSLGYKTFGLEEITGVVVANEYADLYSDSPMKAGRTELDVDGESYVIDYSTTLEDIGEAHAAYITGSTVLTIADAGNTVFETGEGTEINEDNTGMDVDDAARFLNFGEDASVYTSDWRIEYVLKVDTTQIDIDVFIKDHNLQGLKASDFKPESAGSHIYVYSVSFRPDANISSARMNNIEEIFAIADKETDTDGEYVTGEVYVGTRSTDDVSDEMSFRQFKSEYINDENKDADFDESDNGEWLKVIDNDGDGVADYIFLTEFAMSVIDRITRDDEYVLAGLDSTKGDNNVSIVPEDYTIASGDVVTEDELAAGDVVIWTEIDGVYYVDIAEMVTETVDARGINSKTETMTCNGTDYVQSHIGYTGDPYYNDVTDAHTEWTYDLYLDHFGYVRLFIESDYNTFMLLTDASYEDDRRVETFQAMFWDVDADEETQIDVADAADVEAFISTFATGDQETWNRLYGADETYFFGEGADYITNISGYAETDDGYALKTVGNSTSRVDYFVRELQDDADQELDDCLDEKTLDGTEYYLDNGNVVKTDNVRIQTTTDTQYYLVIKDNDTRNRNELFVSDVITWTGYANTPDEAMLEDAVGYAVTHAGNGEYEVADVVVFEVEPYNNHNTYFVYARNNYSNNREYVWGIGYDENGEISYENLLDVEATDVGDMINFYEIYDDNSAIIIDNNYAASDIYAGEVTTTYDVSGRNYIRVDGTKNSDGELYIYPESAPIYRLFWDDEEDVFDVDVVERWDLIDNNEPMILFTDGDDHVQYAIAVGQSLLDYDGDGDLEYEGVGEAGDEMIRPLVALYQDITGDVVLTTLEQAIAAANAIEDVAAQGADPVDGETAWNVAVAAYNALKALINDDLSKADYDKATEALNDLGDLILAAAQEDAKSEIAADYAALASDYTINVADLDAAKEVADDVVDAWTIDDVIDGYTAPEIEVEDIFDDAKEVADAKAAAEAAVKAAYEAAIELSEKYDLSLASAILNQYNVALNAIEAVDEELSAADRKSAYEAITGEEITEVVADCQKVADAIDIITSDYASGSGLGDDSTAESTLSTATGTTVTEYKNLTVGTPADGVYKLSCKITSGTASYTLEWDYTLA